MSDAKEFDSGLMTPEFKIVPNSEIVIKKSMDLKPINEYAVHFMKEGDDKVVADVYYPFEKETWVKREGSNSWIRTGEPEKHPYSIVPVNEFKTNRRSEPLFQAEKPLIDANDNILSKSLNEVDRFNAVILLLSKAIDQGFSDRLKKGDISIIDELEGTGTGEKAIAEYLEKDLQGAKDFYDSLGKTLRMEFNKSTKIPDFWSETFSGGEQAAKALIVKLADLEFKASNIDMYFDQGLDRRLKFYSDVWNASNKPAIDENDYKVVIKSKRNIPVDVKDMAEIFNLLQGISLKTRLGILPKDIVDDVENELIRIKEEDPEPTVSFDDDGIQTPIESTEGALLDAPGAGVQLNGAQVTAATSIVKDVVEGRLPKAAGINMLKAFFNLTTEQANALFEGVVAGSLSNDG